MNIEPKRFAFVDVQNTETTAFKMLGFEMDHQKLFTYLKDRWNCEQIFLYPGIRHGDELRGTVFQDLQNIGAVIRPKHYYVYKNPSRMVKVICPTCNIEITQTILMGTSWKCNCDVEMTVDVLECAGPDTELLLFTGDGDFEFLIQKVLEKGSKVIVVSSARRTKKGPRQSSSRLSTKLRNLTEAIGSPVRFLELNNLKFKLKKD